MTAHATGPIRTIALTRDTAEPYVSELTWTICPERCATDCLMQEVFNGRFKAFRRPTDAELATLKTEDRLPQYPGEWQTW